MKKTTEVLVIETINENNIEIEIGFNPEKPKPDIVETVNILARGIGLLVNRAKETNVIKDYELISVVIKYLQDEFISIDSFK